MKKYYICFFLLAVFLAASILTGAYIYFYRPEHAQPVPGQILESESAPEDNVVINQRQVETREEVKNYCLVAEEGFFSSLQRTVTMYVWIPICRSQNFRSVSRKN